MKLAIGADNAGFEMKSKLVDWLRTPDGGKHKILDLGTGTADSSDYPDYAVTVGKAVADRRVNKGILFCGSGIGMAIAANKIRGVRDALVWNPEVAALASEHNDANVLCLPSRYVSLPKAKEMLKAFLNTRFGGGRHL